jgi:hypothetical protein
VEDNFHQLFEALGNVFEQAEQIVQTHFDN